MIEINSEIYAGTARALRNLIGGGSYVNGTVEYETDDLYSTLTLTAIVYRRTESLPEGEFSRISDIVPVWWEFSTIRECGEALNDFSFTELKPYIIEYE